MMWPISIIPKQDVLREIPKRWREQYPPGRYPDRPDDPHGNKQEIGQKLAALEADATAQEINAIIGNTLWTETDCDVCGKDVPLLARIGEEPDYDARWVDVCPECLRAALGLLEHELGDAGGKSV